MEESRGIPMTGHQFHVVSLANLRKSECSGLADSTSERRFQEWRMPLPEFCFSNSGEFEGFRKYIREPASTQYFAAHA